MAVKKAFFHQPGPVIEFLLIPGLSAHGQLKLLLAPLYHDLAWFNLRHSYHPFAHAV